MVIARCQSRWAGRGHKLPFQGPENAPSERQLQFRSSQIDSAFGSPQNPLKLL